MKNENNGEPKEIKYSIWDTKTKEQPPIVAKNPSILVKNGKPFKD